MKTSCRLFIILLLSVNFCVGQKSRAIWYFGTNRGIDFNTNPPTLLSNANTNTVWCSASICDNNGQLLFYTDGKDIYNAQHNIMANGGGLLSVGVTLQGVLIAREPGTANRYYVFVNDHTSPAKGLSYSVVDMNLAAGSGSVIVKNMPLYQNQTAQKMSAVENCLGDVWVFIHEVGNNNYRGYRLSNGGIANQVVTSIGTVHMNAPQDYFGEIRFSPDGRHLAASFRVERKIEVYDFNPLTGALSNSLVLASGISEANGTMGVEFSASGSKLYATNSDVGLMQWDMCAPDAQSLLASKQLIPPTLPGAENIVRGADNKLYVSSSSPTLEMVGVVNDPEMTGTACNYVINGLVFPQTSERGFLPNFVSQYIVPPFTYTVSNCSSVLFNSPFTNPSSCALAPSAVTQKRWKFGNTAAAGADTSFQFNPVYNYSAPGVYTVMLILDYTCGASDTLVQNITIGPAPSLTVIAPSGICNGSQAQLKVLGALNYTWSTNSNAGTINVSPVQTTTYTVKGIAANGCESTSTVVLNVSNCTGIDELQNSDLELVISPNPNSGDFSIRSGSYKYLTLYNESGQVIQKMVLSANNNFQSTTKNIEAGIYFLRNENGTINRKIVVAR